MRNETPEAREKRMSYLKVIQKGEVKNPLGGKALLNKNIWNWAARKGAPKKFIKPMKKLFSLPRGRLSVEKAIVLKLVCEALDGDTRAIELWMERKYGKVTQPMDLHTESGPLVAILNAPQGGQSIRVTTSPEDPGKIVDVQNFINIPSHPAAPKPQLPPPETPPSPAPKTQDPEDKNER